MKTSMKPWQEKEVKLGERRFEAIEVCRLGRGHPLASDAVPMSVSD